MPEPSSAKIIPFPRSPRPGGSCDGAERLRRALAALDVALATQQGVLANWRDALHRLDGATNDLGGSLRRYQHSLATLSGEVGALGHRAHRLATWADRTLAATTGRPD